MKTLMFLALFLPQTASARVPDWLRRVAWVEDDRGDGEQLARLATHGPVKLRLHALSGDIEIVAGGENHVTAKLSEGEGTRVSFREDGDRVELLFDGVPVLRCGRLCVEVPQKSAVEVTSDSGDVAIHGVGGEVRARATAGDVRVEHASAVEVRAVSGDVAVQSAAGEVRVNTVSGDINVATVGASSHVSANTTSGDVHWKGNCGGGCRLEARTLSGDVELQPVDKSSFALRFLTHDGEIADDLKLSYAGTRGREPNLAARYGSGDGLVEVQTWSGDLHLARAK
jgi:hypothetical protein